MKNTNTKDTLTVKLTNIFAPGICRFTTSTYRGGSFPSSRYQNICSIFTVLPLNANSSPDFFPFICCAIGASDEMA